MEYKMREILLDALRKHAEGHVAKHKANVEVYLLSTTGIVEHPDIIESMEKEIMEIAKYNDVLEMIDKYFDPNNFVM
jgi:septum formation topological specificity factor MinE